VLGSHTKQLPGGISLLCGPAFCSCRTRKARRCGGLRPDLPNSVVGDKSDLYPGTCTASILISSMKLFMNTWTKYTQQNMELTSSGYWSECSFLRPVAFPIAPLSLLMIK
jgi:hypothetical protein